MGNLSYKFGRIAGSHLPTLILIAFIATGAGYFLYRPSVTPPASVSSPLTTPPPVWDEKKALAEKCDKNMPDMLAKASAAFAEKDYDLAVDTLWICQGYMSDQKAKELYTRALTIRNKIRSDETDRYVKAEKARKKKEGVTIGMSEQDVLDSSWGKPQYVNTSTSAYGTRAQWVYGGRNYLYFEDGKLTSIQN